MAVLTVSEIARACEGIAEGDPGRVIRGANSLEAAGPDDLSFVSNTKAQLAATHSHAGCLVVGSEFDATGGWCLIRVRDPRGAFARAIALLYPTPASAPLIHPAAVIAPTAVIGDECYIGAFASIGEYTEIGSGCHIASGAQIGTRVSVGERTTIHSNVTIYHDVRIGARVILHAGCVIGADGFGFTRSGDRYEKFPQIGTVSIEDDVEIGANSCVDRAALGTTRIGTGTKLDNLVHIGHNCDVGAHVLIAAQTGFAGGVVIEDYAILGGQVGIGEKARVSSGAVIGSKAGILSFKTVPAGEPVWGIPARPVRQHLKGLANVAKIPELKEELRCLQRRIDELERERTP